MRISAYTVFLIGIVLTTVLAAPVEAKPTQAQLDAIKANCRSDFMANCWGVKRGGIEAMQCLKEHMSSLSAGCQTAVKAVQPAAPKPAEAPAPPKAPPAETKAVAPEPAPPLSAADKNEPAGTAETKQAAEPPGPKKATKETATEPAAAASSPPAAPPAASSKNQAAAPASPAAPNAVPEPAATDSETMPPIIGFIPPRKKLMVNRGCKKELKTHCAAVDFGDGRLLRCLWSNKPQLSAECQAALDKLTQ